MMHWHKKHKPSPTRYLIKTNHGKPIDYLPHAHPLLTLSIRPMSTRLNYTPTSPNPQKSAYSRCYQFKREISTSSIINTYIENLAKGNGYPCHGWIIRLDEFNIQCYACCLSKPPLALAWYLLASENYGVVQMRGESVTAKFQPMPFSTK